MNNNMKNLITSIVCFSIGIFMLTQTKDMVIYIDKDVGPAFMPKLVSLALIVFSGIKFMYFLSEFKDKKREGTAKNKFKSRKVEKGGIYTIISLFIYFFLFDKLGFVISTILYLYAQITILSKYQRHSQLKIISVSIISPVLIYGLFVYGFQLRLPAGLLRFL